MAHFQTVLTIQPDFALAHNNLAVALLRKGHGREAVAQYQTSLELQPDDARTLSDLAWVLATWPEASVRNGVRAMELAQRANQLSGGQDSLSFEALAAAYAEGGRFAEAIVTVQQALQLATAQNDAALVNTLQAQLGCYQTGSPFRDAGQTDAPAHPNRP
jgi:Flp pilus assembly protein TadD